MVSECLNGHPYDDWNTKYVTIFSKRMQKYYTVRACRTCINDRARARYKTHRGR
jgi:hypothetical protein